MSRKIVSVMTLTLLLIGMLSLASSIQPVRASYSIYIRPNGSVDPSTAPIERDGNVYTLTDNIYDVIRFAVQKDDVIVDGNGYTLQGTGDGWEGSRGFEFEAMNTTIINVRITQFKYGVYLSSGVFGYSQNIIGNIITNNLDDGILMHYADDNFVCNNTITYNGGQGIHLYYSDGNIICGNTIENNGPYEENSLTIFQSRDNTFYHNNIMDWVTHYGSAEENVNVWDDGYPSGGNYHGGSGTDEKSGPNQDLLGSDGIIDYGRVMNPTSVDHYPLNSSFPQTPDFDIVVSPSTDTTIQGSTVTTYTYVSTIAGYDYLVSLSASGQPEGITIDFNPNTGTPYFTSTMTLQVGYSVPANSYPITISGLGSDGKTHSTTYTLTVIDTIPPVANAGPDQTVYEDTLVTFDGTGSSDNVGIVSYVWIFIDVTPQTLTGVNPTYTFTTAGNYTVTLDVSDASGNHATDTVTITVLSLTPEVLIQRLMGIIETWNLPKGTEKSLTSKLDDAIHLLSKGNENGAIHKVRDFINQVEALRDNKLRNEQAEYLISEAQGIIDLIQG